MSGEGRSPKRQRLGSYSPASPPITTDTHKHPESAQPQTPPPSVRMSPSWSQGQTLPGLGHQGPTPPNTANSQSFQSQALSNGGSSTVESEQQTQTQTPATTVGDAEMRDSGSSEGADVTMENAENRRTDHERKDEVGGGVLYKLSTEPVLPSVPAPDADFMSMYSLKNLQHSVARRDPVTGEKINILRKSYTNKVKDLGLEGKVKATKSQNELWGVVDPAWDIMVEGGQTMWQAQRGELMLGDSAMENVLGMLDSALGGMKEGHLPRAEHEKWKGLLGLDEPTAAVKPLPHPSSYVPLVQGSKTGAPNPAFLAKTAPGAAVRNSAPASPRNANGPAVAVRPDRAGKKRRYDESSYEGYEDDGYDTGGVEDSNRRGSGGGKRQKRKDFPSNSPPFSNPTNSAVGVRSS